MFRCASNIRGFCELHCKTRSQSGGFPGEAGWRTLTTSMWRKRATISIRFEFVFTTFIIRCILRLRLSHVPSAIQDCLTIVCVFVIQFVLLIYLTWKFYDHTEWKVTVTYLHLATSEMWCWSGGRGILVTLSLCYSSVYYYNGAQKYEQFTQVGWLYRALTLLGLALFLPSASVSLVFMVLYRY